MYHRVIVELKSGLVDAVGAGKRRDIEAFLGLKVDEVRIRRVYTIDAKLNMEELDRVRRELLVDPVVEEGDAPLPRFVWLIEVGFRPGVTDNVGRTAKTAIEDLLNRQLREEERIYTSTQYLLSGGYLEFKDCERIARELLANELLERWIIVNYEEVKRKGVDVPPPIIKGSQETVVKEYNLDVRDEELIKISSEGVLALDLNEMKAIKDYFKRTSVVTERKKMSLGANPTDVELETLAQTWSEHCKHKIFHALIHYRDGEEDEIINSLFRNYIKKSTSELSERLPWLVSVFSDNSGVISFNNKLNVAAKVETHNAPSALEPYGGAITGIVGVNRDPMGTGMGAKLFFNVFAYCLGDPFYRGKVPAKLLHPRRVRDGVHRGVIDGGNQSGIPLVRGREIFDRRYGEAKPLVYCGTFGAMPKMIGGKPSYLKEIEAGDLIVMVGGRIGKDGIHGATFSSEELHKGSPTQAVQIGDPITQKKTSDFLLEARDKLLYKSITDNGAGGLASSIGEMAAECGGCEVDLEKAPLKYQGLNPWEILLSEAQERMTVGVDPSKIKLFLELADKRDVEATVLGKFTDSGKFYIKYHSKTVAYLDLDFLHEGVPQKKLQAIWKQPFNEEPEFEQPKNLTGTLNEMLAMLSICSTEKKLRQYDQEVKGLSMIKPLVGKDCDVPSDATISLLEYGSVEGLVFAEGLNPNYSDVDTYKMTASVIDEAIRRVIAVGGCMPSAATPFAALDNFCWCDPEQSDKTPDGYYKLAQLVRACKALYDYSKAFNLPFISGKDSMKNDSIVEGVKVSVPPTLMVTVLSKIDDVSKAVTMDVKRPGDLVYIVGETFDELGGSEYYKLVGEKTRGRGYIGNKAPAVNARKAKATYKRMSKATGLGLVNSAHTPVKGGLAIALAQSAFAGGYGMDINLEKIPYQGIGREDTILFSESNSRFIVTVPKEKKNEFEETMQGSVFAQIGFVVAEPVLRISRGGYQIVQADLGALKRAWKATLEAI
ncbi:MAG: phosphoribosylformylglycinamidine synthase subunit PurSL [Thermoproteota archaeon]|nr:phosphoribosylformylglycinamidine synthase subunit PurSL [Thermoproteota archaeon]